MTIAPPAELVADVATSRRVGLAPFTEFMLVGGATLFLLPFAHVLRVAVGLDAAELAVGFVMFHAAHVINDPHFAVTYLLFYRNVRERALGARFSRGWRLRYWVAGLVVPALLTLWVAVALGRHSAEKLGYLLQLMFVLVGWHYIKQGFGVVTVLSARRGVRFAPPERAAVLAHGISAWLFSRANPRDLGREASSDGVIYNTLRHPPGLDLLTSLVFAASSVLLLVTLWRKWRREGGLPFVPLLGFLITVWAWVAFSRVDPLLIYVIPALHSVQYLYFVALQRGNQARAESELPAFASARRSIFVLAISAIALGWFLFRGLPVWLDGSLVLHDPFDLLGETPYFAGIAAFVNIHHYFMDAVIWRRENPESRYLLG